MPDEQGWDSGLSPTEQLIVDYVRQGMRDAEIAVRLGISMGDAKERVAALVRKLGVPDRGALGQHAGHARAIPSARWAQAEDGSPQHEGTAKGRLIVLDTELASQRSPWGHRLPFLAFSAGAAVAGIALLIVSTDEPKQEPQEPPEPGDVGELIGLEPPTLRISEPLYITPEMRASIEDLIRQQVVAAGTGTEQSPGRNEPEDSPRDERDPSLLERLERVVREALGR